MGRFTDRSGHPLAGVVPNLVPVGPYVDTTTDDGGLTGENIDFAGANVGDPSGPDGTFVIRGVDPTSAYRLCADATGTVSGGSSDAAGYVDGCATRTSVAPLGTVTSVPDLALEAGNGGTTVSGTVSGAHHAVPGAFVFLVTAADGPKLFGRTDATGHYAIRDVPPGTYQVCAGSNVVSSNAPTGFQPACSRAVTVGTAPAVVNVALPPGRRAHRHRPGTGRAPRRRCGDRRRGRGRGRHRGCHQVAGPVHGRRSGGRLLQRVRDPAHDTDRASADRCPARLRTGRQGAGDRGGRPQRSRRHAARRLGPERHGHRRPGTRRERDRRRRNGRRRQRHGRRKRHHHRFARSLHRSLGSRPTPTVSVSKRSR